MNGRRLFRVKLVNRHTQETVGHWCLFPEGDGWRLTEWKKGKPRPDPWHGTDFQAASDLLLTRMEENLRAFLVGYRECVAAHDRAMAEGRVVRPGFRVRYNKATKTHAVNTYNTISSKYRAETVAWLARLPEFGWPLISRVPFAGMHDVPERLGE